MSSARMADICPGGGGGGGGEWVNILPSGPHHTHFSVQFWYFKKLQNKSKDMFKQVLFAHSRSIW